MKSFEQMQAFNRSYDGDSKAVFKRMQQWHRTNKPTDGVFCPSKEVFNCSPELLKSVLQAATSLSINPNPRLPNDTQVKAISEATQKQMGLHLFGTWRNSLGIYKIDAEIMNELIKTDIPDDTPSHIFSRLPDWCVYMEMPTLGKYVDKADDTYELFGFWALLDRKVTVDSGDQLVLHIVPHILFKDDPDYGNYIPVQMAISDSLTVQEAIERVDDIDNLVESTLHLEDDGVDKSKRHKMLKTLLPMVLWLCAEEPDISNIKGEPISGADLRKPKYAVNKKTGNFVPPNHPTVYHIGKRLGGEIRQFNKKIGDDEQQSRAPTRKRPHIRRGHWHGVWRGTKQDKQFKLYWQAAIFVNAH